MDGMRGCIPRHRTHPEMIAEESRNRPPTRPAAGALRGPARLFEAVRRQTVTELGGVLSGFWGTIEEHVRLEALAGHDYSGAQDDRMAVMALGHRALELATRYRESLEREFDAWREPPVERSADKSLSLMSEGELEIHLAGQHTTELLDHQFLHPLEQLDERMQALAEALGVEGKRPNPVRPEAAVAAFVGLFGAEDLTRGLRPLVFNQFDKRLPEVLGELYEKLNEMLGNAGFGVQVVEQWAHRVVEHQRVSGCAGRRAHRDREPLECRVVDDVEERLEQPVVARCEDRGYGDEAVRRRDRVHDLLESRAREAGEHIVCHVARGVAQLEGVDGRVNPQLGELRDRLLRHAVGEHPG